jgi:hypothetical protein
MRPAASRVQQQELAAQEIGTPFAHKRQKRVKRFRLTRSLNRTLTSIYANRDGGI